MFLTSPTGSVSRAINSFEIVGRPAYLHRQPCPAQRFLPRPRLACCHGL